jgi:hypothetical protein
MTCCRSAAFSAASWLLDLKGNLSRLSKNSRSATIAADGRRFYHQIKWDEVFSTHTARIDPILANCTTLLQGARDNYLFLGPLKAPFVSSEPWQASRRFMRGGKTVMIRFRRMIIAAGLLVGTLPTVAFAQLEATAERRAACMFDAIMLCSSAIPNKSQIASCLASKMSQLSPQCRAQFVINSNLKGDSRGQSPSAAARQH